MIGFFRFQQTYRRVGRAMSSIAVAAVLFGAAGTMAAENSLSVLNSQGGVNAESYISRLSAQIMSQAANARGAGAGPSLNVDLNIAPEGNAGFSSLSSADQSLIRAAKGTYDLFRSFGGNASDRLSLLQRQDGRYYVGLDGEGGRWMSSPEEAMSFLLQQLVQASLFQLPAKQNASSCPLDFNCLLRALYDGQVEISAHASRDTTITVEMKGEGFFDTPGTPVVVAPEGIAVLSVTFIDAETLQAQLSVMPDAALGLNVLSVYNEGATFRSVADYGLNVLADVAALEAVITGETEAPVAEATGGAVALKDDHADSVAEATAFSGVASGRLEATSDADLFSINVSTAGVLRVTSAGPTDVRGTLETDKGEIVVSDDDSGERYNFDLQTVVAPGVYYLRVEHCCSGTGAYRLSTSFVGS